MLRNFEQIHKIVLLHILVSIIANISFHFLKAYFVINAFPFFKMKIEVAPNGEPHAGGKSQRVF